MAAYISLVNGEKYLVTGSISLSDARIELQKILNSKLKPENKQKKLIGLGIEKVSKIM